MSLAQEILQYLVSGITNGSLYSLRSGRRGYSVARSIERACELPMPPRKIDRRPAPVLGVVPARAFDLLHMA